MPTSRRGQPRFGRVGRFGRSRHRYDHAWWGEPSPRGEATGYRATTRRPMPCLCFVLPLLLVYELGLTWLVAGGRPAIGHRAGADAWVRQVLATIGLTDRWLPPLLLVCGLLAWQASDRRGWRFHPLVLGGMLAESFGLALLLIGVSRLVDLGFSQLDARLLAAPGGTTATTGVVLLGFLGAGIYEETLFRLALIPLLYGLLRLVATPGVAASTLAITASSLCFSLAHHAGAPGEAFSLFVFVFRWLAGVFFAYVFVARGYGVAVGTHSAYDLLVGWYDVRF